VINVETAPSQSRFEQCILVRARSERGATLERDIGSSTAVDWIYSVLNIFHLVLAYNIAYRTIHAARRL
jgi:hypothetical protein